MKTTILYLVIAIKTLSLYFFIALAMAIAFSSLSLDQPGSPPLGDGTTSAEQTPSGTAWKSDTTDSIAPHRVEAAG